LKDVKATDVLYFRRALKFIDQDFPFSPAFGRASTREQCIQSSQILFDKLNTGRKQLLNFRVLCIIAEDAGGSQHDKMKVRELISELILAVFFLYLSFTTSLSQLVLLFVVCTGRGIQTEPTWRDFEDGVCQVY
jgi:hypothetical protein